ncbi:MAG: thioredoxin family protein [Flavobacterium sp. BFFFF2]|nr:MAG: thioredoxin family protein [Flavobacterium sp. BFFFF2]
MKKIAITLFFVLASLGIQAQELTWHTDVRKATKISQDTKKPMFLFFTGSDWCGWCIRLQKEVFKTPEFVKWAKDNVVLVELDFPRRTPQAPEIQQQNAELQQFFQVQGFPTVWFVNASQTGQKVNFDKLGSSGYVAGGPAVWIEGANKIIMKKS